MALYIVYKNAKKTVLQEPKLQELSEHVIDVVKISSLVCPAEINQVQQPNSNITNDHNDDQTGNDKIENKNVKEKVKEESNNKEAVESAVLAQV